MTNHRTQPQPLTNERATFAGVREHEEGVCRHGMGPESKGSACECDHLNAAVFHVLKKHLKIVLSVRDIQIIHVL